MLDFIEFAWYHLFVGYWFSAAGSIAWDSISFSRVDSGVFLLLLPRRVASSIFVRRLWQRDDADFKFSYFIIIDSHTVQYAMFVIDKWGSCWSIVQFNEASRKKSEYYIQRQCIGIDFILYDGGCHFCWYYWLRTFAIGVHMLFPLTCKSARMMMHATRSKNKSIIWLFWISGIDASIFLVGVRKLVVS